MGDGMFKLAKVEIIGWALRDRFRHTKYRNAFSDRIVEAVEMDAPDRSHNPVSNWIARRRWNRSLRANVASLMARPHVDRVTIKTDYRKDAPR